MISAGLQATAAGIDYVVNKQSNTIKAGSEVLSDYQNINQQMSESTSWVKTNAERYEELSKGVNNLGQNLSLTSADYEEYQQLSSQIAQQFPELVTGYDSLGKPIIGAAKSVSDLQTALKNAKFDAYNKNVKEAKDVTGKFYEEVMRSKTLPWQDAGSQKQLDGLEQFIKDYNKAFSTKGGNKPTGYIDLQKYMNMSTNAETGFNASDFGEAYQTLGLSHADIQDLIQELNSSNGKLKSGSDSAKTLTTLMDGVSELQSDVDSSANELKQYIPSFLQANKKYQDLIWDNDGLESKVTSMINSMTMKDLENNGFTDKDNAADNIKKWASNAVNELGKTDIRDSIDSLFNFNETHADDTAKKWFDTANKELDETSSKTDAFSREQMRQASGIADEWTRVKDAMTSIKERYDDATNTDAINRLDTEDLEALGSIASKDTDHKISYDTALTMIENEKRQAELSVESIQKSVESAKSLFSSIGTVISESLSGGLSNDTMTSFKEGIAGVVNNASDLDDIGVDSLLKTTAKGVQLNTKNLKDMLSIQNRVKQADFANAIHAQNEEVTKQAKALQEATEGTDDYVTASQNLKDAQADLIDLKYAQAQYNAMYKQQQDALTDYTDWINAQSTENAGDKYNNMVSGLQSALDAYNKGLTGTDDFKTFSKMISPTGSTDEANFAENYAKAARYLTDDEKGVTNFLNDLQAKDLAEYNEQTKQWAINVQDVAEASKKMGMGKDFMSNMFGRLEDYGFHNNVVSDTQDGIIKLTDAYGNLADAQTRLKDLKDTDPGNTTAIQAAEDEVKSYQQDIEDLKGNIKEAAKQSVDDYTSEIDAAKTKMDVLKQAREDALTGDYDDKTKQALVDQIESEMRTLQSEYSSVFDDLDLRSAEEIQKATNDYNEAVKNATVNKPATPDFGDDTEAAQNYADTLGMVQKAYNDGDKTVNDAISTLSQFTAEEVKGIDLFDGKLDNDKLAPAEKALDSLAEKFGLTKEQAQMLGTVFESMGILKGEDSTTSALDEIQEKGKEAQQSLEEATGKKYKFDFDTTNLDTVRKQLKEVTDDVDQYVTTDENGNPHYTGSQELEDTYKASVAQEQNSEYKTSAVGQSSSDDEVVKAAQDFMKAKNEMDAQTQYVQKGMSNTLDAATEKANTAYETFKNLADKNGIDIDTSDIQTAEDSLLGMDSDKTLKVKADVDTSDAESKMQDLTHLDGSSITINADINTNGGTEELKNSLSSIPPGVSTTVNCTVSGQDDVTNLESTMEEIPDDTPVTITCDVQNQEELDAINKKADELNSQGKQITIQATVNGVEDADKLKSSVDSVEPKNIPVTAKVKGEPEVKSLKTSIDSVQSKSVTVTAVTNGANTVTTLNTAINALHDKTVTITTNHVNNSSSGKGSSNGAGQAHGTMSSPAHASGTVYNVTNYGSAYANGKVGLSHSETALVNELGQESIVRGDRWLMLPPGMHTQSLKKGDIVLNAQQTADLLAHGKANGTARAYAKGSLSNIAPAHAGLRGAINANRNLGGSGSGSKSSSDSSSGNNTNATKANTKATKDNTKSTKKSTSVFDYVARKLTYFANKTKAIADKINDYVTSAFKTSQLKKQISAISNEITVNSKGANAYLKKANSIGLNAKVKKDIREGKYAITDYNTESSSNGKKTQYEKIQEYAKYYDEYVKCTQAVQDLKNQQLELFEQWANMPTEAAEKKIEKLKAGFNGLTAIQARLKTASLGGSAQAYLNNEMKSSLSTATNNRNSAKATLNNATNRLSSANRAYDTAKRNESHVIENADKSKKKAEKAGDKLLRNKSVSLTDSEKKKVASGKTISTKGLSGKKKTAVKKYNTAVKKSNAAKKKASKAKSNTKKASNSISSARSAVTSARSAYQSANDLYQSYATQYATASKYLNSGDTLGYQNYLTDMEFQNTKEQNKANQEAYAQAKKNTQDTLARQTSAKSAVDKASSAKAKAKSTGKSLVSKYKGKLKQSQINALNSGKKVSTKGTSGALKKKLEAYNKALANSANALKQARAQYDQISTEVDIARNAEAQAAANAAESQAETAQAAIEAEKTKFENVSNYYDKRMDYEKALAEKAEKDRDRNEAHGDYTASGDYDKEISNEEKQRDLAQQKVDALKKQLADAMSSGVVKQGTEEWLEMSTTITEAENSVADLNTTIENTKQKQLTTKYEEMFDRAIAKAEQLISKIDTINDLLTEEMMYDYDTGQLTDMGALSLTLNAKSMNDSLDNLQQYVNKRQQIIDDFANGDKDLSKYGEKTYDELMSENDSNIQNALKNANSYKQQILSIVKTQSQKEQDALFKVIDARKEALKKKKEYYDYDKQLKSKTKEINLLQQQIDALDGVKYCPTIYLIAGNSPQPYLATA